MKWKKASNYHHCSDKGYKVTAFRIEGKTLFRAFKPDVKGILPQAIGSIYKTSVLAKMACEQAERDIRDQHYLKQKANQVTAN